MYELFTRPRYWRNVVFHRHTDRAVGWLELFYDLVYVATLIQIGNFLSDNVTVIGFGQFFVLVAVAWWSWTGETFYQNRYVVDDLFHRLLVFIQIFAVASLGLSVSGAFGDLSVQFTLCYVLARLMLVFMYIPTYVTHPESRPLTRLYIMAFSIGIAIWLGSLLVSSEWHWVVWIIGIAVELILPTLPALRESNLRFEVDQHHIIERFGIFTIIVLGESFVKILDDAQGATIMMEQILFSAGGLTVLYSMWWLYFSDTADRLIDITNYSKAVSWIYSHLPLAASLVAFGVGAKKLFGDTIDHPGDPVIEKYRLLYTVAVAMYLVSLALIDFGLDDDKTAKSQNKEALVHLFSAIVVAIIGLTMTGVTATQFVAMIAVVMVLQVGYSIWQTSTTDIDEHQLVGAQPEASTGD